MEIHEDIDKIESSLNRLEEFHGHLGPYIIIGARMALIANELLGDDAFKKKVTVFTETTPPLSCIIDGIQFYSGCTLGKGNIEINESSVQNVKVVFEFEGRKLEIQLKDKIKFSPSINRSNTSDLAVEYLKKSYKELFDIKLERKP
jgi:formylmethanofuran dehydrogenase subunit E